MTLEEAKKAARDGKPVRPHYFGKGWAVVWFTGRNHSGFYDRNPITGSLHEHRFDARDERATWTLA